MKSATRAVRSGGELTKFALARDRLEGATVSNAVGISIALAILVLAAVLALGGERFQIASDSRNIWRVDRRSGELCVFAAGPGERAGALSVLPLGCGPAER